jgi:hypothetical protein
MLGIYTRASTANPTGRRPWNSRLSYYVPNTFFVPTTGQGPFLLNPGVVGSPMQAGGVPAPMTPAIAQAPGMSCGNCAKGMGFLGGTQFPNFATFQRSRSSRRRFDGVAPFPAYGPVPAVTSQLLGQDDGTQILGTTIDPTLLALGLGALLLAVYLWGGGRPKRRAHRLRRKISRSQAKLREIEAV